MAKGTGTRRRGLSAPNRHALRNADAEISTLEKALAADGAHSLFAQTYIGDAVSMKSTHCRGWGFLNVSS